MQVMKIDEFMIDEALINKSESVTNSTVNRYKSTLSTAFQFFIKHPRFKRLKYSNPCRGASISNFKENPAKERFLSTNEQERLLITCKNTDWHKMYLLVLMALTTGARRGDLIKLKWTDIDFTYKQALLYKGKTKNEQPRAMPLTQAVIIELIKFREVGAGLIFNNTIKGSGKPYDYKKSLANAMIQASIKDCRFHDLRHTCASNLAMNGATLQEIADVLGHKTIQMTMRYAHLCTKHKAKLIDRVMGNLGSNLI
jgi:integrase